MKIIITDQIEHIEVEIIEVGQDREAEGTEVDMTEVDMIEVVMIEVPTEEIEEDMIEATMITEETILEKIEDKEIVMEDIQSPKAHQEVGIKVKKEEVTEEAEAVSIRNLTTIVTSREITRAEVTTMKRRIITSPVMMNTSIIKLKSP